MLIFVYGSLKEGFWSHDRYIKENNGEYKGTHITKPDYTMISFGRFPGVYLGGDTAIYGEVYEINGDTIRDIDQLEGYPRFYERFQIPTIFGKAWMYVLASPTDEIKSKRKVEDGVWL